MVAFKGSREMLVGATDFLLDKQIIPMYFTLRLINRLVK